MAALLGAAMPAAVAAPQDELTATLENTPGMQLIAAVDAMQAGDLTKAEALFTLAIQRGNLAREGLLHAHFNRGLARQRMGRLREAVADFDKALEDDLLSPASRVEAYYNRGLARRQLGNLQGALNDYTRAIELNPSFPHPYYSRALILAARGDYLLALVDLNKALATGFPAPHRVHYSKALIHMARGERNAAIAALKKALKIAPKFKPAQRRLAMLRAAGRLTASSEGGASSASLLPRAGAGGRLYAQRTVEDQDIDYLLAAAPASTDTFTPTEANPPTGASATAAAPSPTRRMAAVSTHLVPSRPFMAGRVRRKARIVAPRARPKALAVRATSPQVRPSDRQRLARIAGSLGASAVDPLKDTGIAIPAAPATRRKATMLATASIRPHAGSRALELRKSGPPGKRGKSAGKRGAWTLQLASIKDRAEARRRARALKQRIASLVPEAEMRIVRADLKSRGTYYRLRLHGFGSREHAQAACAVLSSRGISCVLARGW